MRTVLDASGFGTGIHAVLGALVREAEHTLGVSAETALAASRATERALGRLHGRNLSAVEQHRVRAYFGAVVRSQAFKRGRGSDARYREAIRVASLVADLRSIDMPSDRIREEVLSFYGEAGLLLMETGQVA